MKVKCRERERIQIPFLQGPDLNFVAEILREKFFQAGIIQPARVKLRGGRGRSDRLRLEMRATGNRNDAAQERP